jgi:hypothetical protein
MASNLTPAGWIAKFLVAPGICVAVGYYLVGPRIGKTEIPTRTVVITKSPSGNPLAEPVPDDFSKSPNKLESGQSQTEIQHGGSDPEGQPAPAVHHRTKRHHLSPPPNSVSVSSDNYPQADPGQTPKDVGETGSESSVSR